MAMGRKVFAPPPVIKPSRMGEAGTKVGKAGLDRVYLYRRGTVDAEPRLRDLLESTPRLRTLLPPFAAALTNYGCGDARVYADAFAEQYLRDDGLSRQFCEFSERDGKRAVPLSHALGAAFGFHQVSVVIDDGKSGGDPVEPGGRRLWFLNNRHVTTHLSPLPKMETVSAENGAGSSNTKPTGVLKTVELANEYCVEVRRDGTGYYAQLVLGGADVCPKVPLHEDTFPLKRCNALSLVSMLGTGRWTEPIEAVLRDIRECLEQGDFDSIALYLEAGNTWEIECSLMVMVEEIREHGIEGEVGSKLRDLLQGELDKYRGGWRLVGKGKAQKPVEEERNKEKMAFFEWVFDYLLGSGRNAHLIRAFKFEARPFSSTP